MQVSLNTSEINIGIVNVSGRDETGKASGHKDGVTASSVSVSFSGAKLAEDSLGMSDDKGSKGIPELRDKASGMDADLMQDQMLAVSHGMSGADAEEMESEGFDPGDMDIKSASTILDKIKAEMAKSGTKIIGYNDDLDMEKMAAILGSQGAAAMVAQEFARADIPVSEDNLKIVVEALDYGMSLTQPTEGEYRYMLDNEMSADLVSFYLAQNSGAAQRGADLRDIPEDIREKLPEVLSRDGLEATEENVATAEWLYKAGLPVTGEQVEQAQDIKSVDFPLKPEELIGQAARSIADNTDVKHSRLTDRESIYEKAAELMELYMGNGSVIGDAKVLAEIRLRMTAEVNVRMLRNDFSIDTAPMEEMLEALKIAEKQVAQDLFGTIGERDQDSVSDRAADPVEAYRLFNASCKVIAELPDLPEDSLGVTVERGEETSLSDIHQRGIELRSKYEAAEMSYERMWTAPRADLGDRITTAFRNIENMLEEMHMEASEDNTRAVKILGRNSMEISPENIEKIKVAVDEVENVLGKMNPGAVLRMIRDGVNPLTTSLKDLDEYLAEKSAEYDESARDYAEFLYRLEQDRQISPQERNGYIGVYRLIHQIEKGDGAAIGALVEQGAELNLSNLLSAARSNHSKGIDARITEGSEYRVSSYVKGESITDQIAQAVRAAGSKTMQSLEEMDQPVTPTNLLSMQQLTDNTGDLFGNILQALGHEALDKEDLKDRERKSSDETLAPVVNDYLEELTEEIERATYSADTSLDVKSLQLMHKQLTLASSAVKEDEYFFPMEMEGEVAGIHLKLVDGQGEGLIDIRIDLGDDVIEARLQVQEELVKGQARSETGAKGKLLEKAVDIFSNELETGIVEGRKLQTDVEVNQGRFSEDMGHGHNGVQDRAVLLGVASQFLQSL